MSKELQAYKYARHLIERLDEIIIPSSYVEQIEQIAMSVKSRPFKDEEELLPLCYRCSHHNALVSTSGNKCANCGQPYVFSFASFEPLPLVEFVLPSDEIRDEEALDLIDSVPNSQFDKDAEMRQREALYMSATARSSKHFPTIFEILIIAKIYSLLKIVNSHFHESSQSSCNW